MVISEKWDICLERTFINVGIGLIAGGLTGVVLTRSPGLKKALWGFGAGCGMGSSWTKCSQDFEKSP
ncbi:unnamed protein product [Discosporangium mesarthrocarpum]